MTQRHADTPLAAVAVTAKTSKQRTIDALIQASPSVVLLRDGELVLYRRTRSLLYQCRFKLADGKWHRFSTRKASLENAIAAAGSELLYPCAIPSAASRCPLLLCRAAYLSATASPHSHAVGDAFHALLT